MEYPTIFIKIGYRGKDIVQGFVKKKDYCRIMYFIWLVFTLFTHTMFFIHITLPIYTISLILYVYLKDLTVKSLKLVNTPNSTKKGMS